MANPLPAFAAYLLTDHFKVRRDQKILCTAVAAFVPGPLALAPAFVAASNTRQGHGFGSGLFRRSQPQPQHQHHDTFTPVPKQEAPKPDASPPWKSVPAVVGLLRADAISALQTNGFNVGVREIPTADRTNDTVIEQSEVTHLAPPGHQINLTVARAPVPAPAPAPTIQAVITDVDQFKEATGKTLDGLTSNVASIKATVEKLAGSKSTPS